MLEAIVYESNTPYIFMAQVQIRFILI